MNIHDDLPPGRPSFILPRKFHLCSPSLSGGLPLEVRLDGYAQLETDQYQPIAA